MPVRAKLPPGKGKRVPLNMRTTREIRGDLEKAAANSGRSLAQEVEHRLERSFIEEANLEWAYKQFIGDEALHRAIMTANLLIRVTQEDTGVPWYQDPELRKEASELYWIQLDTEAAKLSADADKVPPGKTRKRPARKRVVRK